MPVQLTYSEGGLLPENGPAWAVAASERLRARLEVLRGLWRQANDFEQG
jgi:hypothetical protein